MDQTSRYLVEPLTATRLAICLLREGLPLALLAFLYGAVYDALAECFDDGNRPAQTGAEEYLCDPPERILDTLGGGPRGVVKCDGKVIIGVHVHLLCLSER